MRINTGDDKKAFFFCLIWADFIIALQIAAVSFFPRNLIDLDGSFANGSFLFSFVASFLVFLIFSGVFEKDTETKRVIRPGLIFIIFGSLIDLFLNDPSAFILGRAVLGLGAGMVLAGQIGIIWQEDFKTAKNFSLTIMAAFISGLIFGPAFLKFLSGPNLSPLQVSFVFAGAVSFLPFVDLSKIAERLFSGKWIGMISGWGIWYTSSVYYDRVVFPVLMLWLGNLLGGIIASFGAMLICLGFLLYYEKTKSKWISSTEEALNGIAQRIRKIEGYNFALRLLFSFPRFLLEASLFFVSQRGTLGFVALSCLSDPFVTLSYYRKDRTDGLNRRDWFLFLASGVIANAYWILYTSVILVFVRAIWEYFSAAV